ncbi:MAG: hypothetical protein IPL53_20300 [Ignavibacteria bacterium]|nr:hypothetical protein [Ignavibacteria bacterium]
MDKQKEIQSSFNYFNGIPSGCFKEYNNIKEDIHLSEFHLKECYGQFINTLMHFHKTVTEVLVTFKEEILNKGTTSLTGRHTPAVRRQVPAMLSHLPQSQSRVPAMLSQTPEVQSQMSEGKRQIPEDCSRISLTSSRVPEMHRRMFYYVRQIPDTLSRVPAYLRQVPVTVSGLPADHRKSAMGQRCMTVTYRGMVLYAGSFPVVSGGISPESGRKKYADYQTKYTFLYF